jgi:DNA-binding PadR family transcriptional regulator
VLGIIWRRGPCTAYVARHEFLDSPSPYWSGSAGAVYPVLGRLERGGWVRAQAHATGRRESRRYVVTPRGRAMLGRWLGPPLPDWILGVPPDPLRTRMSFLGALSTSQQARLLAEAERAGREQLALVRAELKRPEIAADRCDRIVASGAVAALEARVAWLAESRARLGGRATARKPGGGRPPRSG